MSDEQGEDIPTAAVVEPGKFRETGKVEFELRDELVRRSDHEDKVAWADKCGFFKGMKRGRKEERQRIKEEVKKITENIMELEDYSKDMAAAAETIRDRVLDEVEQNNG